MSIQKQSKTSSEDKSEFTSWRIFDKRKAAIESDISKGFRNNLGFLLVFGGLYMSFAGHWVLSAIYLTNSMFHFICLLVTAYINREDIGEMGEGLHHAGVVATLFIEVINGLLHRSQIEYLMRNLGRGVHDYGDTLDEDSNCEIKIICADVKRNKSFYSKIYTVIVLVAGVFVSVLSVSSRMLTATNDDESNDDESNNDENFNGIIRSTPVVCWYPFDSREPPYNIICHILQQMVGTSAAAIVLATDLIYLYIGEEIVLQLKIVGITMRNAMRRARKVMASTGEKDIKKSLATCLSHSVEHHVTSLRLVEALRDYYYYLLLCIMIGGALLLCLAGFVFCRGHLSATSKLTFLFLLSAELVHILIFCWYGEQIKEMNFRIGNKIYESDWINYSCEMKTYSIMVTARSLIAETISAGGFADMSMVTFSNVISSAYSYFNLLNATDL